MEYQPLPDLSPVLQTSFKPDKTRYDEGAGHAMARIFQKFTQ